MKNNLLTLQKDNQNISRIDKTVMQCDQIYFLQIPQLFTYKPHQFFHKFSEYGQGTVFQITCCGLKLRVSNETKTRISKIHNYDHGGGICIMHNSIRIVLYDQLRTLLCMLCIISIYIVPQMIYLAILCENNCKTLF